MTTRAVLFDFGGTLDSDGVAWRERFHRLFREEGLDAAPGTFDPVFYGVDDALVGTAARELSFRQTVDSLGSGVAAGLGAPAAGPRVAARFHDDALRVLAARRPMLERLAARYRLGIVSNFYGNLARVLADVGLADLFAVAADSEVVGARKPDARIFHAALSALEVDAPDALFVGDSRPRDMEGARALGMPHVLLAANGSAPGCCQGDPVIASLTALEGLLA